MTHAETELARLKEGFEKWQSIASRKYATADEYPNSAWLKQGFQGGATAAAQLFFPFVAYALNDMQGSASKTAMLNRFKAAMGMELMAHEKVGLE